MGKKKKDSCEKGDGNGKGRGIWLVQVNLPDGTTQIFMVKIFFSTWRVSYDWDTLFSYAKLVYSSFFVINFFLFQKEDVYYKYFSCPSDKKRKGGVLGCLSSKQ